MKITFEKATIDDAETLISIRNLSFYSDYIRYGECPGYNISKDDMINSIRNGNSYKILCDKEVAGNISIKDNRDGTYYLGCLCVIPSFENKGIGKEALRFIESEFPDATAWTLQTPSDKEKNHYFYKKMGYIAVKEYIEGAVRLSVFEKKIS